MKLLKFFAVTVGATVIIIATMILWIFAAIGAGTAMATTPVAIIPLHLSMVELGNALLTLLINGSATGIIFTTTVIWFVWSVAIFEEEVVYIYRWVKRLKIVAKKSDTL